MKQPFTTKYPTISEMMPIAMRRAFFARVLGKYAFKLSSILTKPC